ncbi:alpha/beta hydrolase family protein [Quadrisphaera sp. GCM10027208]|uniref:alpha/beta hydrolase family protein n=1 Tax=Quadrisphaera sp. GCM10027208 TaxID=3273423 RepID=UPI003614303E
MSSTVPPARAVLRAVARGAVVGGGLAVATGAATSTAAAYFARRVVTPERHKPDDVRVLSVGPGTITLRADPDTTSPGRYGIWFDRGHGHARLGRVLERDDRAGTVTRVLEQVDYGRVTVGPARWNQYYVAGNPTTALRLAHEDVLVRSDAGELPTWYVPPSAQVAPREVWAVLVHGRGATREECLRALPLLHRLGVPALVPSYRNDPDGPSTHGGRLHLGDTEWLDVEAAVLHALDSGAREVVLFGWSMGGAIVLQHVSRSWTADRVRALVLDAPVIDWRSVLDHHARLNRLPRPVGRLGLAMLGHPSARRVVGVDGPVDLRRMDWVSRASELRLPVLIVHSEDDEFVPVGPSRLLAQLRPDLVTFVPFRGARHTKEWNVDPDRWEREVARFLLRHL